MDDIISLSPPTMKLVGFVKFIEKELLMPEISDHEHCPCVERLRKQNKESSDLWTRRTAEMLSDLQSLRYLMAEARTLHREGPYGISAYGQAALATALKIADEAEAEIKSLKENWHRELRRRKEAEARIDKIYDSRRDAEYEARIKEAINADTGPDTGDSV